LGAGRNVGTEFLGVAVSERDGDRDRLAGFPHPLNNERLHPRAILDLIAESDLSRSGCSVRLQAQRYNAVMEPPPQAGNLAAIPALISLPHSLPREMRARF
jgi:hypothetical protein